MKYPNPPAKSVLFAVTALMTLCVSSARADYLLTNAFRISTNAAGTHIAGGDVNRSLAYSVVSNQLCVANKGVTGSGSTPAVDVFDGTTGAYINSANMTGVSGGTFLLDQIGVADDGVLYGGNLNTAVSGSSFYKIYRWADWTQAPAVAFNNDPTLGVTAGKRVGDTMAITGAGTNTLILVAPENGTAPTTNMLLFSTTDGANFTSTVLAISGLGGLSSGPAIGFCFFTNNTFLYKPNGSAVYIVQYPANFPSLPSPVAATVIATNSFTSGIVLFDANPAGGLLASLGPLTTASGITTIPVGLYGVPPLSGLNSALVSTATAHTNVNGNAVGAIALGGVGKTNMIYSVDCNNNVFGTAIAFVPPQPPTIATPPVGISGAFPPYTLSVAANGSKPISYQWQMSPTNTANSFTNIPGANTNTYTVNLPGTNYFQVVLSNSVAMATSTPVLVSLMVPVTNSSVSLLYRIPIGASGYPYLANDNESRGIAYDAISNRVVVATISGGASLYILDGSNGTNIGSMNTSGALTSGTKAFDQVGIADDGAVYSGNLALTGSGDAFHLTRWTSPATSAAAYQAYNGDPGSGSGERWGDYMAVRGAGPNTQILLSSKSGTNAALLTTTDGSNFVASLIAITNLPGGFGGSGIAFGAGNTLWAKNFNNHLFQVAYDPVGLKGGKTLDYSNPGQIPSQMVGISVDRTNNILGGVVLNDNPNDFQLCQLTGTSDPPVLFHQAFFATANANGNANGASVLKYPRGYAIDVNNGIVAVTYGAPATTAPQIVTPPANTTAFTNDPAVTLSVSASGSLPLYYQWMFSATTNAGSFTNIPNATNSSYVLSNPSLSAGGYYQAVVHNVAGSATSAPPALLTLIAPVTSPVVTQLWTLGGGSRSYLDNSSYNTRGLAYDTNTGILLVADHFNLYLLAGTNGSDLGSVTPAGMPNGGVNGWTIDQIGIADDGVLYSCNLSAGGTGFAIISYTTPISPTFAPVNYAFGGSTGADPSGTGDRWGDTMDVRGAGTGTQIICGSQNGTVAVIFDTADGTTFSPHVINVTAAPAGFAGQGVAFGAGNTFWAKGAGFSLRQVSYDTGTGIGTIVQTYQQPTDIDSSLCGIDVDVANNILAGISFSDTPDTMRLYQLSGNANPPALFEQALFGSKNANSQFNAVTTLKSGKAFGLDVNNGLTALTYGIPLPPSPVITGITNSGTSTTVTWTTFNGRNYQLQSRDSLTSGSWSPVGSPIIGSGLTASATDTSATPATRFYRVSAY